MKLKWSTTLFSFIIILACSSSGSLTSFLDLGTTRRSVTSPQPSSAEMTTCQYVKEGWGPRGSVALRVEKFLANLEVPWSLAFINENEGLITERPGRVRLFQNGALLASPVAKIDVTEIGEGGLLGLALDPNFKSNRKFFIFYTISKGGQNVNRVERYTLSAHHDSAKSDGIILDDIPAASIHSGGRIKFGPDGNLYVSTGDGGRSERSLDKTRLNGKILKINPNRDSAITRVTHEDLIFVDGLRNSEAFDWVDSNTMIIADHGPSGDLGLSGLDEVSFASLGSHLGWPIISGCRSAVGQVTPILTWKSAAPPAGGVLYQGNKIPEFKGNFIIGMLGFGPQSALQLHRIIIDPAHHQLVNHEVYLQGQYGRLRDVVQGPDEALYVTTSNCDGRGTCPEDGDIVLRITHG